MRTLPIVLAAALTLATPAAQAQDKPTVVTGKLPAKAECLVCSQAGAGHGEEKPAGGVQYKGKTYYFCDRKEIEAFVKDPDAYLPPVLPRPAPAFSLKNLEGTPTTLASLKGKVALVDFWATWCAPCVKAMPDLQKLHEQYAAKGLRVVGVSIDVEGAKKVAPFIARNKYTYTILLDDTDDVWKTYGVHAIPALFLIDKNGRIVRQWTGTPDKKDVEKAVADLLE